MFSDLIQQISCFCDPTVVTVSFILSFEKPKFLSVLMQSQQLLYWIRLLIFNQNYTNFKIQG